MNNNRYITRKHFSGEPEWVDINSGVAKQIQFIQREIMNKANVNFLAKHYKFNEGSIVCYTTQAGLDSIFLDGPRKEIPREQKKEFELTYIGGIVTAVPDLGKIFFTFFDSNLNFYIDISKINNGEAIGKCIPVIGAYDFDCQIGVFAYYIYPGFVTSEPEAWGIIRVVKFLIKKPIGSTYSFNGQIYRERDYDYVLDATIELSAIYYTHFMAYSYNNNEIRFTLPNGYSFLGLNVHAIGRITGYRPRHIVVWFDHLSKNLNLFDRIKYRIYASMAMYYRASVRHTDSEGRNRDFYILAPLREWYFTDGKLLPNTGWDVVRQFRDWEILFGKIPGGYETLNKSFGGLDDVFGSHFDNFGGFYGLYYGTLRGKNWDYVDPQYYEFLVDNPGCYPIFDEKYLKIEGLVTTYHTCFGKISQSNMQGTPMINRTRTQYIEYQNERDPLDMVIVKKTKEVVTMEYNWTYDRNDWMGYLGIIKPRGQGFGGGTVKEASIVDINSYYYTTTYTTPPDANNGNYMATYMIMRSLYINRGGVYIANHGNIFIGKYQGYTGKNTAIKFIVNQGGRRLSVGEKEYIFGFNNIKPINKGQIIEEQYYDYNNQHQVYRSYFSRNYFIPKTYLETIYMDGINVKTGKKISSVSEIDHTPFYRIGSYQNVYSLTSFFSLMPIRKHVNFKKTLKGG